MRRDQQDGSITRLRGLQIRMLGRPRLEIDGQPLGRLIGAKQQALVFFLAGEERAVTRARLATLFWGRLEAAAARSNLRVALSRLRKLLPQMLAIDDAEVGLSPGATIRIDFRELEAIARDPSAFSGERIAAAARSWRGHFLEGFELGDADEFDDWVRTVRPRASRSAIMLRRHLAGASEAAGDPEAAIGHLRAWLDIDDADEEAHMALIRLQAGCGRRTAAIAQYEACRAALLERLGARPSAVCFALYRRIHADAPQADAPQPEPPPAVAEDMLVGRASELRTLRERLLDPQCRWLTIVGPGGIGKTRLAQAVAAHLFAGFADGHVWFSGRELGDPGGGADGRRLAATIVQSVMPARDLLVVLDNLETVPDARGLADELLARLPGATLLATSRLRIGGSREWLLELAGLDLARNPAGEPGSSAAALLFRDCLHRVDPRFDPHHHTDAIERICSQVGGLPLAIELAAQGAGRVGIAAMAARIEAGLDLADPERPPDDPHRSLDVVLEDSWTLLPEQTRVPASLLAALPDEFDVDMAASAGVTLDAIEVLRKHSWLGRTADGQRLTMHPLQRQYLRRQEGAEEAREQSAARLADALRVRLPAVAPFGDLPAREEDTDAISAPEHRATGAPPQTAILDPPAVRMASDHVLRAWPEEALAAFVDGLAATLVAQDQHREAAALLERAGRSSGSPGWQRIGWLLRCAEVANECGETVVALRAWRIGFGQMGLGDLEAQALLPQLSGGVQRLASLRDWPQEEPQRSAFSRVVARGLMQFGQHVALTSRPMPLFVCGALQWLVAIRVLGRPERACAGSGTAYGNLLLGWPKLSRIFARRCERHGLHPQDERMRLLAAETVLVCKVAQGQWPGLLPQIDELVAQWQARHCTRHEMECRSLAAKLAYYQGLLTQAERRFGELTLHADSVGPQPGRFWGPMGEAEAAMALGSMSHDELRRLFDRSRQAMAESENMDSAYTLRWFGLRARFAIQGGDIEALRETTMAGAAAASRIPFCGFWAHEGFAGVGEGLIRLRRHEGEHGGSVSSLADAWRAFRKPLRAHCRRFPPARGLWHYLHALDAAERDRRAEACEHLRRAVRVAEAQGMRLELARACRMLGLLENDAAWATRAGHLFQDMGAAGEAGSPPPILPRTAPARLARV